MLKFNILPTQVMLILQLPLYIVTPNFPDAPDAYMVSLFCLFFKEESQILWEMSALQAATFLTLS